MVKDIKQQIEETNYDKKDQQSYQRDRDYTIKDRLRNIEQKNGEIEKANAKHEKLKAEENLLEFQRRHARSIQEAAAALCAARVCPRLER